MRQVMGGLAGLRAENVISVQGALGISGLSCSKAPTVSNGLTLRVPSLVRPLRGGEISRPELQTQAGRNR